MADPKTIGEYEILEPLGEGGFGIVYKARANNGILTAIKVLNPQALDNEKVVKKFFHEAMILARLDHPNITKLFEFFPAQDAYAIVMEYVEGITLKEMILSYKGKIPHAKAMDICQQILAAFQYAHENGIIHRDIKPGNIMINDQGVVKIMDFGIAKISSAASSDTRTTWKWGAPHYMAPERFYEDGVIDARSDIYSLGVVFHETFTGRRPFESNDTVRIISCHLNEIPRSLQKYAPEVPEHINQAILKALEKDPNNRFSSCIEFARALSQGPAFTKDHAFKASEDDATHVVEDDFIDAASEKTLLSPPAETAVSKASKATQKPQMLRYLIGLVICACLIAAGHFFHENILDFFRKPQSAQEAGSHAFHTKNAQGYWETKHPADGALMVEIPQGEFTMGSDQYDDEKPVQRIFLADYHLDKTPVTNKQFAAFVASTFYVTDAEKNGYGMVRKNRAWEKAPGASWKNPDPSRRPSSHKQDDFPVTQVSYRDAQAYCRWAKKDLPTEAQWEKAARGQNGSVYPWGDNLPDDTRANFNNPDGGLVAVGKFGKNGESAFGVSGMAGNVYQWCRDWYAPGVREYRDPLGPQSGSEAVVKGGSFIEGPVSLRSANRDHYPPDFSSNLFGFRCACKSIER